MNMNYTTPALQCKMELIDASMHVYMTYKPTGTVPFIFHVYFLLLQLALASMFIQKKKTET
jgi:hypothetical protein